MAATGATLQNNATRLRWTYNAANLPAAGSSLQTTIFVGEENDLGNLDPNQIIWQGNRTYTNGNNQAFTQNFPNGLCLAAGTVVSVAIDSSNGLAETNENDNVATDTAINGGINSADVWTWIHGQTDWRNDLGSLVGINSGADNYEIFGDAIANPGNNPNQPWNNRFFLGLAQQGNDLIMLSTVQNGDQRTALRMTLANGNNLNVVTDNDEDNTELLQHFGHSATFRFDDQNNNLFSGGVPFSFCYGPDGHFYGMVNSSVYRMKRVSGDVIVQRIVRVTGLGSATNNPNYVNDCAFDPQTGDFVFIAADGNDRQTLGRIDGLTILGRNFNNNNSSNATTPFVHFNSNWQQDVRRTNGVALSGVAFSQNGSRIFLSDGAGNPGQPSNIYSYNRNAGGFNDVPSCLVRGGRDLASRWPANLDRIGRFGPGNARYDFDGDGNTNDDADDFIAFFDDYINGRPWADLNRNGQYDQGDINAFIVNYPGGGNSAGEILINAEDFNSQAGSGASWTVGNNGGACGGQFVSIPNANNNVNAGFFNNPPTTGQVRELRYNFSTSAAGDYNLYTRLRAQNNNTWDRAYWFRFNNGPWQRVFPGAASTSQWRWIRANNTQTPGADTYNLPAGNHTLSIRQLQDGAQLDRFVITPRSNISNTAACNP